MRKEIGREAQPRAACVRRVTAGACSDCATRLICNGIGAARTGRTCRGHVAVHGAYARRGCQLGCALLGGGAEGGLPRVSVRER